jgi:Asp-tRNA(Asn)/Glu-tRNA(Gln) amidotransferase A subunit family amidase
MMACSPLLRPENVAWAAVKMTSVLRMNVLKVMCENKIDVFVNPEQTTPTCKLGMASEPEVNNRLSHSCCGAFTALMGAPEADVPAGCASTLYEPHYVLSPDQKRALLETGTVESKLPHPMPIGMIFWSGLGSDSDVNKAASAYESATHHCVPPPSFSPLKKGATGVRMKTDATGSTGPRL